MEKVINIANNDTLSKMYRGCGFGVATIKDDEIIKLEYIDDDYENTDDRDELLSMKRSNEQNIDCKAFTGNMSEPKVLENGNIEILVNFSCYQLCRF